MARGWEKDEKRMTRRWQEDDKGMTRGWQEDDKRLTRGWQWNSPYEDRRDNFLPYGLFLWRHLLTYEFS